MKKILPYRFIEATFPTAKWKDEPYKQAYNNVMSSWNILRQKVDSASVVFALGEVVDVYKRQFVGFEHDLLLRVGKGTHPDAAAHERRREYIVPLVSIDVEARAEHLNLCLLYTSRCV